MTVVALLPLRNGVPVATMFRTETAEGVMVKIPAVLLLNVAVPVVPLPAASVPPECGKVPPLSVPPDAVSPKPT